VLLSPKACTFILFFLIQLQDITMVKDPQLDQMATDMSLARQHPAFDVKLMETFLVGGEEALSERVEGRAIMEKEPLFEKSQLVFMSREDVSAGRCYFRIEYFSFT
jgi:hypothetical protein